MKFILKLTGNLNELKGKLKQKLALITNNDLLLIDGKQDEVIGRIQAKLRKPKQDVLNYIAQL